MSIKARLFGSAIVLFSAIFLTIIVVLRRVPTEQENFAHMSISRVAFEVFGKVQGVVK